MKNKYMPIVDAGDGTGRTHRNIPIMMNTIARSNSGCISFFIHLTYLFEKTMNEFI